METAFGGDSQSVRRIRRFASALLSSFLLFFCLFVINIISAHSEAPSACQVELYRHSGRIVGKNETPRLSSEAHSTLVSEAFPMLANGYSDLSRFLAQERLQTAGI